MNCDAIMKLCKDTRTNMDKIEKLLKKSLNKTHNLSNPSFLNNTSSTAARKLASPTPRLARGAVGRFSLGAARLPTARKSLTSKISGVAIRNNQAKGAEGKISKIISRCNILAYEFHTYSVVCNLFIPRLPVLLFQNYWCAS